MKARSGQIAQVVSAVAFSLALACSCAAAFAHAGAAGASGGSGGASASGASGAGGSVGGGGFGGHGVVGGHGIGQVASARGFAHVASNLNANSTHLGALGGGVVSPIWDPNFWSNYDHPKPKFDPSADSTTSPATVPHTPVQTSTWFYCPKSRVYYPYVRECTSGWQQVSPRPSS